MPKQNFQRPAPVNHNKIPSRKGSPFGQDAWNRKKGKKPVKPSEPRLPEPRQN